MADADLPVVAVVEDDAPSRDALARLLRASGFEPVLFPSAEAFINAPPPRAICLILDVHLGGISGIDLQRRLRTEGSTVPIVVTTAFRDDAIRDRAEQTGCTAFLWKPFSGHALLGVIAGIARESPA